MDDYEIISAVETTSAMLDAEETPEAFGYLSGISAAGELPPQAHFAIAQKLLACDKPAPLPKVLRDFVEELFLAAFDDGVADALNNLGALYYGGSRGFPQDFAKALKYYKTAAEKGSRQAQENLGYCYYYGRSVPVDYEKAFHYFALGAFDGHINSLYKIGDMYQNGYYVEKNPAEAFYVYWRCLETMTDEAAPSVAGPVYLRLGNAFLSGNGTDKNPKSALACFQKAETYLYDMVASGDSMYKKSLEDAVKGQTSARALLEAELSDKYSRLP